MSETIPEPWTWERHRYEFRKNIAAGPIVNFMEWSTTNATIRTGDSPSVLNELEQLRASPEWERWRLAEQVPINGTLVHQVYSLWQWEKFTGQRIHELSSIAEFGAGYGEMANLCFSLGFQGTYYIFDFPELIEIQKTYIVKQDSVVYCDNADEWQGKAADLMIGICSLSEAPFAVRDKILSPEQGHLIRFQDHFFDMDSRQYFDDYSKKMNDYSIYQCEHYTPHWYLLSKAV